MEEPLEKLLTPEDLAELLGVPVATVYQWRHKGTGPQALRVGRHLRYEPKVVRGWIVDRSGAPRG